jgi:hypothetical protein
MLHVCCIQIAVAVVALELPQAADWHASAAATELLAK